MAFTTPKTWSFGEILTSTDMNTYVRDNTEALRVAGMGTNVVTAVKLDTFTSTSTSYEDVTGMEVTITPSSATAKVLVIVQTNLGASVNVFLRLTGGNAEDYVADADGVRSRTVVGLANRAASFDYQRSMLPGSLVVLDAPATAAAVTYKLQMLVTGGSGYINKAHADTDAGATARGASSITAIEVAA